MGILQRNDTAVKDSVPSSNEPLTGIVATLEPRHPACAQEGQEVQAAQASQNSSAMNEMARMLLRVLACLVLLVPRATVKADLSSDEIKKLAEDFYTILKAESFLDAAAGTAKLA